MPRRRIPLAPPTTHLSLCALQEARAWRRVCGEVRWSSTRRGRPADQFSQGIPADDYGKEYMLLARLDASLTTKSMATAQMRVTRRKTAEARSFSRAAQTNGRTRARRGPANQSRSRLTLG